MNKIESFEKDLTAYAMGKLKELPDITLYGASKDCKDKVSIIPFNITDVSHDIVARALAGEKGISVRNGCFCAQPYVQKLLNISNREVVAYIKNPTLKRPGMVRLSFGLYNTYEEIDILVEFLRELCSNKEYFIKKYRD